MIGRVMFAAPTRRIGHRGSIFIASIVTNNNGGNLTSCWLGPVRHFVFARWRTDVHDRRRRRRKFTLGKSSGHVGTARGFSDFIGGDDPNYFRITRCSRFAGQIVRSHQSSINSVSLAPNASPISASWLWMILSSSFSARSSSSFERSPSFSSASSSWRVERR